MSDIEARLTQRLDNLQYQFLLARYSTSLGDYERAIAAYEQVVAVDRSSPRVLAELAQALFLGNDNQMSDRKSTRLNSSHVAISYAVFCFKKKNYTQWSLNYVV